MSNQEYFDEYLLSKTDCSKLDILEQLKLFRTCAPFECDKIEQLFGKEFTENCTKIGIISKNYYSANFFVCWPKLKDFETFVKNKKAEAEQQEDVF